MNRAQATLAATLTAACFWPGAAVAQAPAPFVSGSDWARAEAVLASRPGVVDAPVGRVRVVIVPHHWLAGHLILAGIDASLADAARPRRVILLSPDHRHVSRAAAMTVAARWSTLRGTVLADAAGVAALAKSPLVGRDPATSSEHGIGAVMPALADRLPGVFVLPVAVRSDVRKGEVAGLAAALAPMADGALIVASVDFSHGLDVRMARRNDVETVAALRRLDPAAFLEWGPEHADGTGVLPVAFALARGLGADRFEFGTRSDSFLEGGPPRDVTTYVVGFVTSR